MLSILASGTLVNDPKSRMSATGKGYCTAAARIACDGGEPFIASLICFDEHAVSALLSLKKNDSLAVTGLARLSTWERKGEQHHGLNVVVSNVMSAYSANKQRKQARDSEEVAA